MMGLIEYEWLQTLGMVNIDDFEYRISYTRISYENLASDTLFNDFIQE